MKSERVMLCQGSFILSLLCNPLAITPLLLSSGLLKEPFFFISLTYLYPPWELVWSQEITKIKM